MRDFEDVRVAKIFEWAILGFSVAGLAFWIVSSTETIPPHHCLIEKHRQSGSVAMPQAIQLQFVQYPVSAR